MQKMSIVPNREYVLDRGVASMPWAGLNERKQQYMRAIYDYSGDEKG